MRPRTSAHDQAVARRLEQLSAELARERPDLQGGDDFHDGNTRVRPATGGPWPDGGGGGRADGTEGLPPESGEVVRVPVPGRHAARRRGAGFHPAAWLERAGVDRAALGPGPVAVVAVLAALGLAVACWWLLRGQPEPVQLEATSVGGLATPVASGTHGHDHGGAEATGEADAEVVVDVAGRVRRPGIVVLRPGSRVVDALEKAGGPRRGVDLTGLNLARVLVDGEQVLVGVPASAGPAGAAGTGGSAGGLLNLNTATSDQLQELPGVGPVTAEAILAFRTDHGPFTSVEELLDVKGIGEATLDELAPHVTV